MRRRGIVIIVAVEAIIRDILIGNREYRPCFIAGTDNGIRNDQFDLRTRFGLRPVYGIGVGFRIVSVNRCRLIAGGVGITHEAGDKRCSVPGNIEEVVIGNVAGRGVPYPKAKVCARAVAVGIRSAGKLADVFKTEIIVAVFVFCGVLVIKAFCFGNRFVLLPNTVFIDIEPSGTPAERYPFRACENGEKNGAARQNHKQRKKRCECSSYGFH